MGIFTAVADFEHRHPAVQHLLSLFSVDHLTETEKVATKFEDLAGHIAGLLPDGPAIHAVLGLLGEGLQHALVAVAAAEGATPEQLAALADAHTVTQATPAGNGYVVTPVTPTIPAPVVAPSAAEFFAPVAARLDAQLAAAVPVAEVPVMPGADHPVWWPSPAGPGDAQPVQDASAVPDNQPAPAVAQPPAQPAPATNLPTLGQRLAALSTLNPATGAGGTGTGDSGPLGAGHAADATADA